MGTDFLSKIILYNFLYVFSRLEYEIKEKFKQELQIKEHSIQRNFIFLHLASEIGCKFIEDIDNNALKIRKMNYLDQLDRVKMKWSLKQCLEFANGNGFLDSILIPELPHLQKREELNTIDIIKKSIQIRNCLAHETFGIQLKGSLELLSDEKLEKLINDDSEFNGVSFSKEIDDTYKYALTYYFYIKTIEINQ